ncbi:hypothetical protein FKO01_09040 [Mesorhizobium sp. B2-3-3]|uniref:hypothetical protein n=1 Tax=unclassified Mesorhizobium TaxID=325217 RepID=UPI001126E373|nr:MULTISPECIES: hypothetical protein [unclassified Mesorhizobium]TPK74045.1 hypothetical protein FJ930_08330 [Mesorhizobium sp. B2-4-15]TPM25611.1 hypothetical protein FJ958_21055 [Mesorhizobium sp. B2-3-5]TPN36102.1 hypothetical protein FKO01_09040 [Mesorhizobium sp. B2-3-3]
MNILVSILLAIVAGVVLTIAKAISVAKMIKERTYSWVRLGVITALWIALTLPSMASSCGAIGCAYGLHFGWMLQPFEANTPSNAIFLAMGGYAILSVYFFGHILGLVFSLFRANSSPARDLDEP